AASCAAMPRLRSSRYLVVPRFHCFQTIDRSRRRSHFSSLSSTSGASHRPKYPIHPRRYSANSWTIRARLIPRVRRVSTELNPVYRRLLKMAVEPLQFLEQQIGDLDQETASLLRQHQDAVERLAEVPGLGVDSAQQIIAEVGAKAATFASAKALSSWVGACPGEEESAGVNRSKRSPKGNRQMRRILNQAANASAKHKGHIFEMIYRV